jgi:acetyl-CoA acetyltransferase family protein
MKDVFVIDAIRTPIGKYGGILSSVRPDDLLAHVIRALISRNDTIDPASIEEVIAGAANQSGEDNRNVARMAALLAGLPVSVAGNTVNRLCASGLQAIMDASRQIMCGDAEIIIAGGVESMTRAPFVMGKNKEPWSRKNGIFDPPMGWLFIHPAMGETAENIAKQWNISREEQDLFAFNSHEKYFKSKVEGKFDDEISAVEIIDNSLVSWVTNDEHPRKTSLEKLAALKPAFVKDGTVTAGNSSGINDGAAALFDLKPLAKIISMAVAGLDPSIMGVGPVPATHKALQRAGLKISDIGLVELNEAFASQSLACIKELDLNITKVNVNGGAIALGHPLGCSGARISATLLHEMKKRNVKYGLATMCVGVGQGASVIYQLL